MGAKEKEREGRDEEREGKGRERSSHFFLQFNPLGIMSSPRQLKTEFDNVESK